jgi:hypothetical protein
MDTIQIEITNACVLQCSNCTRLVGHSRHPFYMDVDFFKKAVDSLKNFPKMIGVMGGEPLLHPRFEEISLYLHSKVPKERCGLWSTFPKSKKHYAPLIAEVYGNVLLNDHTTEGLNHAPVLVSGKECIRDDFLMWYHIEHCWIQNSWSASITPKGAFFCEVAAAFDMVFNSSGGWPVELDWWKKTPKDYTEQMERFCVNCGVPYPLRERGDSDGIDDMSYGNFKKLKELESPKIKKGRYHLYVEGLLTRNPRYNGFRHGYDYFNQIAAKYGMYLKKNKNGYLQPLLQASEQTAVKSLTDSATDIGCRICNR